MKTKKELTQETVTLSESTANRVGEYQVVVDELVYNNYQVSENELNSFPEGNHDTPFVTYSKYPTTKKDFVDEVYNITKHFSEILKKEEL